MRKEYTFLRYFLVGISTVAIDYFLYLILIKFQLEEVFANVISVFVSVIFNFLMQNYWSFRAGGAEKIKKITKYIVITTFNYFFNVIAFYFLFEEFLFEKLFNNICSLNMSFLPEGVMTKFFIAGIIMCWNYFIFKYWVFKKNEP